MVGTGFPLNDKKGIQITLCGNKVTNIISVSNQLVKFIIPKAITTCSSGGARLLQAASDSFASVGSENSTI